MEPPQRWRQTVCAGGEFDTMPALPHMWRATMTKSKLPAAFWMLILIAACVPSLGQSASDPDINKKIRQEESDHSQIMHTMHFLTDVYGPRLTGSPNHKAAADWAIREMTGWGFANAHLEPWDFGHPGWMNERASGYVISPIHDQLTFRV